MPRTKVVRKERIEDSKQAKEFASKFSEMLNDMLDKFKEQLDKHKMQSRAELKKCKLSIPKNLANKTLGELMESPVGWSGDSTSASVTQIFDATRTMTGMKNNLTRSNSFGDDEGGRQSRTKNRIPKTTRISRSQSVRKKNTTEMTDKYKTPAQRIPITTYGTVTPKVKPNTPQVLLRRPKQGEVALSLQGSPLLTGNVVTDNVANINIPLEDGRLFSIQPQRGLRVSQIPELDLETKRQLETLRDNLNKVCALATKL
ncbi:borealin isoform X2 [Tribolium madens]|uniref:borealin isoform X2 n=1 Tax=Tribolium madens TaxID=41895 RepID=UPI001CF7600C|nr:borealin isoform X2 [Tribolium madens]